MEFRQLLYFVTVAEYGNFRRASESLFVTQPALSKQISELEKEFSVKLFDRSKRAISLTETGMLLLPKAKSLVSDMYDIKDLLVNCVNNTGVADTVSIGTEDQIISTRLIRQKFRLAENRLAEEEPRLGVEYSLIPLPDIVRSIRNGELDVGMCITHDIKPIHPLNYKILLTSPMSVLVPRRTKDMSVREEFRQFIDSSTCLMVGNASGMRSHIQDIYRALGVIMPREAQAENFYMAVSRVGRGEGIFFVPKVAAPDGREEGIRRIDLPDEISPVHYVAMWLELKTKVERVIKNYSDAMGEIRYCEVPDLY